MNDLTLSGSDQEPPFASLNVSDSELGRLKLPPHSIEAEQSILGALLCDNQAWDRMADAVSESDFYRSDHRSIFHHIAVLIDRNQPADTVTVYESLKQAGQQDEVGGIHYLDELARNAPGSSNIRRYSEIVRERAILRRLISTADEIAAAAFEPQGRAASQVLDEAEAKIFAIAEDKNKGQQGLLSIHEVLSQVIERIEELASRDDPSDIIGTSTGYVDLDSKLSGLHPGDLIIVAGRPSMGKTAFSLNIGEHVAVNEGLPVLVFSMEMGASQLAMRMLGSLGRIDQKKLRTGQLEEDDWHRLTHAIARMNEAKLFIDETPALNPIELRARSRRLARQYGGVGLIIIDYLQLMSSASVGENRATEISEISRSLKALAKELGCPVIALSQLNRGLEQRTDKRPVMSDLRESGAIEQDADVILFIYRDEVYHPDTADKGTAEIIIGKQRNGPIGKVRLSFLGHLTKFENYVSQSDFHVG